ncbi:MAG: chemotaxis protein CheC [Clostridiales bacterium]|nr:chemotaxis protein CheC [Clostridiales bacterium]
MISDMKSLNQIHIDILREIGNIGVGNAISSLSALLNAEMKMTVPEVKFLEFKEVGTILGGDEVLVFGILVQISGDINGMMMFLVKPESARALINSLMGGDSDDIHNFNEMEQSALQEIGNILCSSYLGALSGFINKTAKPTPPVVALDMATAILSVPAIEFGKMADGVLFIDTVIDTPSCASISGFFLLVPDMDSFNIILTSLGVM